jgi:hypothetical protein
MIQAELLRELIRRNRKHGVTQRVLTQATRFHKIYLMLRWLVQVDKSVRYDTALDRYFPV